jgi:type IV secretory pathway TraG/TraD family ATPase VirD4
MRSPGPSSTRFGVSDVALVATVLSVFAVGVSLWLGAQCAVLLRPASRPRQELGLRYLLLHPGDPADSWGQPGLAAWTYWTVTGLVGCLILSAAVGLWVAYRRHEANAGADPRQLAGLADARQIKTHAGSRALLQRARYVRPSLSDPAPNQVGYRLGLSRGRDVWVSVEDSIVLLGPPRSGKGLHLVIPMILDAPGAVVTTSTRPDNQRATMRARSRGGPVAVFDPQHLASEDVPTLRWSPVRGCANPQIAMVRARALAAGTGNGVDGGDFWQGQTESVLRGLLHAAALDDRPPAEIYRWSLSPAAAGEAVRVLNGAADAATGWSEALDNALSSDTRTRDSIWLGVRTALACLGDPRVLAAVTPADGEKFDPDEFLRDRGTLYLLGTASGAGATANLIGAYIEDVTESARGLAARSAGGRLDPPLALVLDEVANYPLPSLPALMSDGGGNGITTVAVLQSLAQARATWGEQRAGAIWDSAIVKVVLGGGSNARDLADLAALIGERDEDTTSEARDGQGLRSFSQSVRRVPVMEAGRLRTLPFGTGVLLLRAAAPIVLDLQPWTKRRPVRVGDGPAVSAPEGTA